MGMQVGGAKGGPRSEINVTPLVDVVLVVLIIFMVTMPVLLYQIDIEVPEKSEEEIPPEMQPDTLTIEVCQDQRIYVNGTLLDRNMDLPEKVGERLKRMQQKVVFVDFDDHLAYADAVRVVDQCTGVGATAVAIKLRDTPTAPGGGEKAYTPAACIVTANP